MGPWHTGGEVPSRTRPPVLVVVVTGVAGSGKSTVGRRLAARLGWTYAEGDDFHSPENIARMAAGRPLTDAHRLPWLRDIRAWIDGRIERGEPAVVTCSCLRRAYRQQVAGGDTRIRTVFLDGDRDTVASRVAARTGHFFPPELLDHQFDDLQRPGPDEAALREDIEQPPDEIVADIVTRLGLGPTG